MSAAQAQTVLKMTEEELQGLLRFWDYEEDAIAYAGRLWASSIRSLRRIANAAKADLAAVLARGKDYTTAQHLNASNIIAV